MFLVNPTVFHNNEKFPFAFLLHLTIMRSYLDMLHQIGIILNVNVSQ